MIQPRRTPQSEAEQAMDAMMQSMHIIHDARQTFRHLHSCDINEIVDLARRIGRALDVEPASPRGMTAPLRALVDHYDRLSNAPHDYASDYQEALADSMLEIAALAIANAAAINNYRALKPRAMPGE